MARAGWAHFAATIAVCRAHPSERAPEGVTERTRTALSVRGQGLGHARWGTPEEVADVIVVLLSRATRFVNGAVLRVDGGQWPVVGY